MARKTDGSISYSPARKPDENATIDVWSCHHPHKLSGIASTGVIFYEVTEGTFRRSGERNVVPQQPNDGHKEESAENASSQEEAGPRFKKGTEDLDQVEGIEKRQQRSRKARREQEQTDTGEDPDPQAAHPLIDSIEKSKRRLKNRFKRIKDYGDAIDEFGS
jgi:hypothetical protein